MNDIIKCIPQRFTIDKRRLLILSEFQFDQGIDAVSFHTISMLDSIIIRYRLVDIGGTKPAGIFYLNKEEILHLPWDTKNYLNTHSVTVELYDFDGLSKINDDSMLTREGPVL